jgi:hypothetical protein
VVRVGREEECTLVECFDRKPIGIPKRRCKDNIKMDLRVIGWGSMGWIYLL